MHILLSRGASTRRVKREDSSLARECVGGRLLEAVTKLCAAQMTDSGGGGPLHYLSRKL